MRTLRGLVFDLDGTLIDSFDAITVSLNHARQHFGLSALAQADVRRHVGRGLECLVAELVGPSVVSPAVRRFRESYARVFAERTSLLPEVAETLAALHSRGCRMSVASNKPARFGAAILEDLGVARLFDEIQGPDRCGSTKPDPAMIRACLGAMRLRADQAAYVGDMPLDVESGRRAGLAVLLVPTGGFRDVELQQPGARLVERFAKLLEIYDRDDLVPLASPSLAREEQSA